MNRKKKKKKSIKLIEVIESYKGFLNLEADESVFCDLPEGVVPVSS